MFITLMEVLMDEEYIGGREVMLRNLDLLLRAIKFH